MGKFEGKNKNAQKNVHGCTKFWACFGTPWLGQMGSP